MTASQSIFLQGEEKGETKFAALVNKLLKLGLFQELEIATSDKKTREELYKKYNIPD